jgi:hypothetical protein
MVLAGLVLVLGLLMAVPVLLAPKEDPPPIREGGMSNLEAMTQARQPGWVALINPVIGVFGVLAGAGMKKENGSAGRQQPE